MIGEMGLGTTPSLTVAHHSRLLSWLLLWGLAAIVIGTLVSDILPIGTSAIASALDNLAAVIVASSAALLCQMAAGVLAHRVDRTAWRLLALGFAASAIAEGIWMYDQQIAGVEVPFPSAADPFYLAFYPLTLAGILLLLNSGDGWLRRGTTILDSLVFTLGVSGLVWQLILAPLVAAAEGLSSSALALVVAYPVGDLLLIFALCSLFLSRRRQRASVPALLLLASLGVMVVADLGFAWLNLRGEYAAGSPIDPLWTISYALAGCAAFFRLCEAPMAVPARASGYSLRPALSLPCVGFVRMQALYLALALAVAAGLIVVHLTQHRVEADESTVAAIGLSLLLFGLVMARQFLTILGGARVSRSLAAHTEGLRALNTASVALNECLDTDDAARTGLRLACQAVGCAAGVVWLQCGERGMSLVASRRLRKGVRRKLETVIRESSVMHEAMASPRPTTLDASGESALRGVLDEQVGLEGRLVVVPLLSRGVALGAMGFFLPATASYDSAKHQLAQAIGCQLGVVVGNAEQYERVCHLAERDSLTGLLNRGALQTRLEEECQRAVRAETTFSCVMMDLDEFKIRNDSYGHQVGDELLRQLAAYLASALRASDIVGRYGGDEFLAILPDTDVGGALVVCEHLRSGLAEQRYVVRNDVAVRLCLSLGVASYPADGRRVDELLAAADARLYCSKRRGGDQITGPGEEGLETCACEIA